MKTKTLHPHFKSLFNNYRDMKRFLLSIKQMPTPEGVQAGKDVANYGLYWRNESWALVYYVVEDDKQMTRLWSLRTGDITVAREIRDSIRTALDLHKSPPRVTGLRGARWIVDNPKSLEGLRVTVSVTAPGKNRRFISVGNLTCVDKALAWRENAARDYMKNSGLTAP